MENNFISAEMIRGHIDTIILLSLKGGDRDSKEICLDIEKKSDNNYKVKQGTFYSAMQRLVKQAYIKEYRSSAADGIRRKYYTLTDEGRDFLEKSLKEWDRSKEFIDDLIDTPSVPVKKDLPKQNSSDDFEEFKNLDVDADDIDISNSEDSDYFSDIGQGVLDELIGELSENDETENFVKHSKIQDNIEENEINYESETFDIDASDDELAEVEVDEELNLDDETEYDEPIVEAAEVASEEPKPQVVKENEEEPALSSDDRTYQQRDYKSILGKLFPKDRDEAADKEIKENSDVKFAQIEIDDLKSEVADKEEQPIENFEDKSDSAIDFSDLYAMANREGFKIKTSHATNKHETFGIFINKLRFHTSLLFFAVFIVEYLILQFAFSSVLNWPISVTVLIPSIVLILPIVTTIIYVLNSGALKEEINSFKNAIEIALIISFQILIIILGVALFVSIDLSNFNQVLNFLIVPIIFDINIPLYVIIKYLLLDSGKYIKK